MAGERGQKFLAESGGFLAGNGLGSSGVVVGSAAGEEVEGASRDGEQCFALE